MPGFCRDCLAGLPPAKTTCGNCKGSRILDHAELDTLTIAHLDCDAFYASVEKRDDPSLQDKPLIVGGSSRRGVVLTACYLARKFGVKSAMPMFQAMKLCPHAMVIPPDMDKYAAVAREVRKLLLTVTPIVQPVSLDEAYLDLSGTERLHGMIPAKSMARLATQIESTIGITVSIGLSYTKFLAKLASDLQKPRGFAVIGKAEAKIFLRDKPVGILRGVGPVLQATLLKDGITRIGQLQDADAHALFKRYSETGNWLHRLANGEDHSTVDADSETKSISAETTFEHDIAAFSELERILWDQAERVSARAKAAELGGRTITLKLKTASFRIKTRSVTLDDPTQLADVIFRAGRVLLQREAKGKLYRLLGIGLSHFHPVDECDPPNLLDKHTTRLAAVEHAMDDLRTKFGADALLKGRSLRT
jgi:DNA polymerase IV